MSANLEPANSPAVGIEVPVVSLNVKAFAPPEKIKETVIEESSVSGEKKRSRDIEKPFSCELIISKEIDGSSRKALGLTHVPNRDVPVKLSIEKGELKGNVDGTYQTTETRTRKESYNSRWVPGSTFYYTYVPGHMESDTREVEYDVKVVKEQGSTGKLKPQAFQVLYLGIEKAAQGGDPKAKELLKFLDKNYKAEAADAKLWMKEQIEAKIAEMQSNVEELAKQLRSRSLPRGHR